MFSFKFYVHNSSDMIRLMIINHRRKAEISLGIASSNEDLEDALGSKPQPKNVSLSRTLGSVTNVVKKLQCEYLEDNRTDADAAAIKRDIMSRIAFLNKGTAFRDESEQSGAFMPYFLKCVLAKANAGYRESCQYTYSKIEDYCKKSGMDAPSLTFDDINLRWLNSFDEWLTMQGAAQNSRNIHFKNIRTVMNRAIDEELTSNYPFRRFKIRPEATRKRSMKVEELRKLFTCDVEPYQELYRDMFKLIFMLCGINAVDLFNLERITPDGRVEYRRAKTHRLYSVKVEPEAMEIIQRWRGEKKLLCLADRWKSHKEFTKWINVSLKKIGDMKIVSRGGKKEIKPYWPDISSYWARHSWATIAYNGCGISKDVIAQALGHSTGSSVTEIYLDKDPELVDKANRRLIDYVLYGRKA